MQVAIALLSAVLSMQGADVPSASAESAQWLHRGVQVGTTYYPVAIFVPALPAPSEGYPVLLFLHGSGERGSDGEAQTRSGLGPYVRAHGAEFPAITVFPQAPLDSDWSGDQSAAALAAIDLVEQEFPVDADRIYLTGMSRGGYGVWEVTLRAPERFSALVPVCAGVIPPPGRDDLRVHALPANGIDPYASLAQTLPPTPVWLFHGALDNIIPPHASRQTFAALQAAGHPVQYTEFADANHNAWDAAYASPALWTWLFAQRRHSAN
ncbi:MAG: prolyl oligopeptidase family serine peptidase [Aquimonas sp.]|jgi:predicted peptidase|nr:prolyl oligopeptidase family serine peptidase [Xanthomonadales bacterium]MCC6505733.1 prolyl oligopeptidase family serine peptidase [Aquimonas sp.]OQA71799.1 MAG: Alpha/beta hydrolase family protein [Firmicutes bacterium ADurb.Bin248]